jgi:hypothetical protein
MKKKTTLVVQPDKTETVKPETQNHMEAHSHVPAKRSYLDFSVCDHSHGRLNRFPFGSDRGPF